MKELKLKERKENVNVTFEPIDAGNGLTIVASKSVNNGKRMLQCDLKKDGKDVGHASWNDDAKRLFLQIFPMDELTDEQVQEASGTMLQCILQMLND